MKAMLLTVLFAASVMRVWSQAPAQSLEEYRTKAETACQKLNGILQTQGTAIAAALVAKGDTAGASHISKQIEAKLKGEAVTGQMTPVEQWRLTASYEGKNQAPKAAQEKDSQEDAQAERR